MWRSLSRDRRNKLREEGMDFVEYLLMSQYKKPLVFWILHHFNTATLTLTVREDQAFTLDESHVIWVYGLKACSARVSEFLEHNVAETKTWRDDLGLPSGNKGFASLGALYGCMQVESDMEKWFRLFVLYCVGCLFKPTSNGNVDLAYLGIFYRRDAPSFKEFNWPQHILEIIRASQDKVFVEYDIHLVMLCFLDLAGPSENERLPALRPTIRNWTTGSIKQRVTRLGELHNLCHAYIIPFDASKVPELRPRSEEVFLGVAEGKRKAGIDGGPKSGTKKKSKLGDVGGTSRTAEPESGNEPPDAPPHATFTTSAPPYGSDSTSPRGTTLQKFPILPRTDFNVEFMSAAEILSSKLFIQAIYIFQRFPVLHRTDFNVVKIY